MEKFVNPSKISRLFNYSVFFAHQCPQAGGRAVILARVIYAISHPNEFYDDASACAAQGYYRVMNPQTKNILTHQPQNIYFSVSPNPSDGNFRANYYFIETAEARMLLFNSLGNVVKIVPLLTNQLNQDFNCQELSSGFYTFKIVSDNQILNHGKLSIVK